jgi:hypothetical protein
MNEYSSSDSEYPILRIGLFTQLTKLFLAFPRFAIDSSLFHLDRRASAYAARRKPPHVLGFHLPEVDSC